jgi:DNA-binding XRE family transcriptional regulator
MNVHVLEHEGKPAFVVLPFEEYQRLMEALEDASDVEALTEFHAALCEGREETFPAAVVDRLLAGEHPVRVLREHRRLTLQQVADACGVTASAISQIEQGKRDPSVGLLEKLAAALKVDVGMLL